MAKPLSIREIENLISSVSKLKDNFDDASSKVSDLKGDLAAAAGDAKKELAIKKKLRKAQEEEAVLKAQYNKQQKIYNDAVGENVQDLKEIGDKTRKLSTSLEETLGSFESLGKITEGLVDLSKKNGEELAANLQENNEITQRVQELTGGPTLEMFRKLGLSFQGITKSDFTANFNDYQDKLFGPDGIYTQEIENLREREKNNLIEKKIIKGIQKGLVDLEENAKKVGDVGFDSTPDAEKFFKDIREIEDSNMSQADKIEKTKEVTATFEGTKAIDIENRSIQGAMKPVDKLLNSVQSSLQGIPLIGDMLGDMVKGPLKEIGASVRDNLIKTITGKQGVGAGVANVGKSLFRLVAANPFTALAAAAIGVVLVMRKIDKAARDLANELSLGRDQLDGQLVNLKLQEAKFKALNLDASKLKTTLVTLSSEFKDLSLVTAENAASIEKFAQNAGIGGDEVAKLSKQLMVSSGLSFDQALSLQQGAAAMADAAGVASGRVLKDMATSAEEFAKFSRSGAEGLAEAAVAAADMGLNLDKVLKVAEGLINIEQSLTKEFEAQVLTGRVLNLEKARQAAFAGNEQALISEIQAQVGGIDDFQAMSVVQKQAISDAIGLSVSDIMRLQRGESLDKQDTQIDLQKQNIDVLRNGFLGNKEELRKLNEKGDGAPGLYGNVETSI